MIANSKYLINWVDIMFNHMKELYNLDNNVARN